MHRNLNFEKKDPQTLLAGIPFPCGKCLPCRINKQRVWTTRLELESFCYEHNLFITLTYADEHLPLHSELSRRDIQLFIKRLRKRLGQKIRYYICGEYGPSGGRPHYHGIIFGVPDVLGHGILQQSWNLGYSHQGSCTADSCRYVAKYILKHTDKLRTDGRISEFALMSRKPAIGIPALLKLEELYVSDSRFRTYISTTGDAPYSILIGGHSRPLGRTLQNYLRQHFGADSENELFITEMYSRWQQADRKGITLTTDLLEENQQRSLQAEQKVQRSRTRLNI